MSHSLTSIPFTRRSALRTGAMLGGGAAASVLPFGTAFAQQGPDARWPQVAALVRRYVNAGSVAGIVTAMGLGDRPTEYVNGGNRTFASESPVDADSLFRIYSMTKPVTGMAAMICMDDGLLELDQPLHEILPAFRNMQVQKTYDGPITRDNLEPAARAITIRHLLTHTAGLGYSIVQSGPIRDAYMREGINPGRISNHPLAREILGDTHIAPSLEVFADRLAQLPLVRQPGTRWSYSVGLDLLGRVIEVVSGQQFAAFLQSRIFDPLGMVDTHFRVPRSKANRMTGNYFVMGGMPIPIDLPNSSIYLDQPEFAFGGAGLVSSARDYDRFLHMIANYGAHEGEQIISEAGVRLGTSDLFPDTLAANGRFVIDGVAAGFGAGGMVGLGDLAGLYGWAGAAGTTGFAHLPLGLRATLMTQYMPAESLRIQSDFPPAAIGDAMALAAR